MQSFSQLAQGWGLLVRTGRVARTPYAVDRCVCCRLWALTPVWPVPPHLSLLRLERDAGLWPVAQGLA